MILNRVVLLAVFCALLACPVLAVDMNVTASAIGTTYIVWHWDSGYTLTHMLIDGVEICGYDTIGDTFLQSGLDPDSLHTISVTDDINLGYSAATTLPEAAGGGDDEGGGAIGAAAGLVAGLIGAIIIIRRKQT